MPDWNKKTFTMAQTPYQIQSYIGAGSHASVWLARAAFYPHAEVVIKIAHETKGIPSERVENEIWFLKEMQHEHIPTLLGHGIWNGYMWLCQPFYQKLSLPYLENNVVKYAYPEKITENSYSTLVDKIPYHTREQTTIAVLRNISQVIHYISGTNIVHADISPGNIMEKNTRSIQKKYVLIDWGASALIHRYPEKSFGSLHFSAPERLFGEVGTKSDIFSLGIICFYLLTGLVPYTGETGEEYYQSTQQNEGVAPSWFVPQVHSNLDAIIRDMIRRQANLRPEPQDVVQYSLRLH